VLIVEDEPIVLDVYKAKLNELFKKRKERLFISEANSCAAAYDIITKSLGNIDFAILDLRIPPSPRHDLLSGIDVGNLLRIRFPKIKLIVITANGSWSQLYQVFEKLKPNSCLVKSSIDANEIDIAFGAVLNDESYHCALCQGFLQDDPIKKLGLDQTDLTLLKELTMGATYRDLEQSLLLSKRAVEYRKKGIKDKLNVSEASTRILLLKAKSLGII